MDKETLKRVPFWIRGFRVKKAGVTENRGFVLHMHDENKRSPVTLDLPGEQNNGIVLLGNKPRNAAHGRVRKEFNIQRHYDNSYSKIQFCCEG